MTICVANKANEKKQYRKNDLNGKLPGAFLLCVIMILYASIYFNNTFPLSEGWNVNYAELVLQGNVPYRDFYYYLPPLNLLLDVVTWKLSFGLLIVYRAWWFAQRVIIFELLFFLLCRYYKPLCAFLACSFASVLGTASVYDLFGDYNQTVVLLSVILIYCAVGFAGAKTLKRKCVMLFLAGILFALLFLNKQTIFLASALVYFSVLSLTCWQKKDRDYWKYCLSVLSGAAVILIPTFLLLAWQGALIPFIEQVFLYTGGKGSLADIVIVGLLNKLPHILVWLFVGLSLLTVYFGKLRTYGMVHGRSSKLLRRLYDHDEKRRYLAERVTFLVLLSGVCFFCRDDIAGLLNALEGYTAFWMVIFLGAVPFLTVLVLNFCKKGPAVLRSRQAIFLSVVLWCAVILIGGYAADMDTESLAKSIYYGDQSDGLFSLILNGLYFAVFYFVILLLIRHIFSDQQSRDGNRNDEQLWILCGAFSTIYAAAMASGSELSFHGMMPGLAFVLCEALSVSVDDKALDTIMKSLVIFGCTVLAWACIAQKTVSAYSWWGGSNDQARSEKTYSTDIPALRGFYFPEELKDTYEGIVELIEENCDEDAVIYGFPYIKIFNILTDRYNYDTFVPVMFYDVVGDIYVEKENELLEDNLPDILIWQDIPGCMEAHEAAYRDGELLEQRNTVALFQRMIPTNYEVLGTWSSLTVYKLKENDETECFAGGSGSYDDPFLIETAEQLMEFGERVNEGISFEGCYIKQTADIDLQGYDWIPIGEYDSGTYFYGTYDGAGHVIRNLDYDDPDGNGGVFGALAGEVYNLGVEGGSMNGSCVGGIASHSYGENAKIINCYTDLSVSGTRAGGIADNFAGVIENCFSAGELSGVESANVISYIGTVEIENVFVDVEDLSCGLYTMGLYDSRITYCSDNALDSAEMLNIINEYVDTANKGNSDVNGEDTGNQITLVYWTKGTEGYPVFEGQPS